MPARLPLLYTMGARRLGVLLASPRKMRTGQRLTTLYIHSTSWLKHKYHGTSDGSCETIIKSIFIGSARLDQESIGQNIQEIVRPNLACAQIIIFAPRVSAHAENHGRGVTNHLTLGQRALGVRNQAHSVLAYTHGTGLQWDTVCRAQCCTCVGRGAVAGQRRCTSFIHGIEEVVVAGVAAVAARQSHH